MVSHFTGNPNSGAVAQALAEQGALAAFHTTLVLPAWLRRLTGAGGRRTFPEVVEPHMKSHAWREVLRLACRSVPALRKLPLAAKLGALDQVVRWFDGEVSRAVSRSHGVQAVYAYMDAAEQTFLAARARGLRTIYELPTPYWRFTRDVVKEEADLRPDWAATLPVLEDGSEAMLRRDRELQLADVVVVPSELVRDSLKLAPPFKAKVHVVPYGCPPSNDRPVSAAGPRARLRVLYVGSLNQGKGLAYLAEAMSGLEGVAELTVIGSRTADKPCAALDAFLGAHRHRAGLSHAEVLAEMQQHDVLVLPTLYEGLALVLLEAMACGLTVVTTPHSGLEGLIQDGQEGFVVPVRSAEAIRERLKLLAADEGMLLRMRSAALSWNQEHSWQRFREDIRQVVQGGSWSC
ncbi:glycosyltransferase family 4 protein [Prosthecobacter fluviatilis]|uniref:Glycosyltransferase family 4 protein n=1 Tax=Prosthecobacter fluviatilis TaxID=445931 RepID=A0ABW0KXK5_9BACT